MPEKTCTIKSKYVDKRDKKIYPMFYELEEKKVAPK
jgi:hypothetical protein